MCTLCCIIYTVQSISITQVQYLKLGLVPRRVGMGWSGNMTKLNLISRLHGTNIQGELHFQELVWLMPLNLKSNWKKSTLKVIERSHTFYTCTCTVYSFLSRILVHVGICIRIIRVSELYSPSQNLNASNRDRSVHVHACVNMYFKYQ